MHASKRYHNSALLNSTPFSQSLAREAPFRNPAHPDAKRRQPTSAYACITSSDQSPLMKSLLPFPSHNIPLPPNSLTPPPTTTTATPGHQTTLPHVPPPHRRRLAHTPTLNHALPRPRPGTSTTLRHRRRPRTEHGLKSILPSLAPPHHPPRMRSGEDAVPAVRRRSSSRRPSSVRGLPVAGARGGVAWPGGGGGRAFGALAAAASERGAQLLAILLVGREGLLDVGVRCGGCRVVFDIAGVRVLRGRRAECRSRGGPARVRLTRCAVRGHLAQGRAVGVAAEVVC